MYLLDTTRKHTAVRLLQPRWFPGRDSDQKNISTCRAQAHMKCHTTHNLGTTVPEK